jgi:hypothetical protein
MNNLTGNNAGLDLELENADKSYLPGALGAVAGAIVGAIPWAIAYSFGWFVGWLGLIIGFCAAKGYDICKGKQKKPKALIIVLAIIIGVASGQIMGDFIDMGKELAADELGFYALYEITYGEMLGWYFGYITEETGDFIAESMPNFLLGLLFAGLGCWALVKDIIKPPPVAAVSETPPEGDVGLSQGPQDVYVSAGTEPEVLEESPERETADL